MGTCSGNNERKDTTMTTYDELLDLDGPTNDELIAIANEPEPELWWGGENE